MRRLQVGMLWFAAIAFGASAGLLIGERGRTGQGGPAGDLLPPHSQAVFQRASQDERDLKLTCFESELDRATVVAQLRDRLRARGWTEDLDCARITRERAGREVLSFRRGDRIVMLQLQSDEGGRTLGTNISWRRNPPEDRR